MFIGEISLNKTWPRNKYLENNNTNNNKKKTTYTTVIQDVRILVCNTSTVINIITILTINHY